MRIGLFTDTYFPQVSGVATSIRTLKTELEKLGHTVFIFTTTDKDVEGFDDWTIIRLPSIPFFAFKERRIAYAGFSDAIEIAKRYQLEIIHTQTEFSLGFLGLEIGHTLGIPVVHTYHTQYEDYVRYIARGMIIRPSMVKYYIRRFSSDVNGIICPSQIVANLLKSYKVKSDLRVIPTGIDLAKFERPEIQETDLLDLRHRLGIQEDETMLLSLSRISYEKNIQAVIKALPQVLEQNQKIKLVIAGGGPYESDLQKLIKKLGIENHVLMTGMIAPSDTALYYKAADFFISASTSETQGLTYIESLASGTPVLAHGNPYLEVVVNDPAFGRLFYQEEDMPRVILEAIADTPAMTLEQHNAKLYEISAENFGKTVYQYYLDIKIAYDFRKNHLKKVSTSQAESIRSYQQGHERRPLSIVKRASRLPRTIAVGSSRQSKRFVRASKRTIRSIRNLLD
ncbi:glycosyltransferase family 4 protein [Streptococcus sp. DD13]|uniref:glycosyltransferase family 4 protein n=1 Tax=Streptococcus sp. DD13 TaxID=1777881 RepID=UPI00079823A4|nr:glycosyltransferase family 4 protein [Streptococcus sp. DD13]KXT79322.1 Glycosyltransferase LafA, responsible for the formation of Glc-DAG [Streptococcus sp. DD13]